MRLDRFEDRARGGSAPRRDGAAGTPQRVRRRADRRARGRVRGRRRRPCRRAPGRWPVLLGRRRRRVDALVGRPLLRRERGRRAAPTRDARRDRLLPRARDRTGTGSRAGRRMRPCRLLRHRRCGAHGAVCVQRGEARHRPRSDLAVRAREDRAWRSSPVLRHRRAVLGRGGAAHRVDPRGRRRPRRSSRARRGEVLTAGPLAARAAKELARTPLPADETARRIAAHRASPEGQEGLRAFLEKRTPSWRE